MASNAIPKPYDPVIILGEDASDGLAAYGATLALSMTEAQVRDRVLDLTGREAGPGNVPPAEPGLKADWNTAKANKTAKTALLQSAKSNGRALAMACMGVLKPRLGNQWNSQWAAAGFTNNSLRIPDNPLAVLQQIRGYFVNNPTHEVPTLSPYPATAAACLAAANAISAAATASNQSNTDAGTAQAALKAGIEALRDVLGLLREELTRKIGDDDERWYAFGFNKPSDPETPEVPENLVATPGAAGSKMLFLDCDDARRGEDYRFIGRDGLGNEVFSELRAESEATVTLSAVASGTVLSVTVSARNNAGGESQPSAPITVTVP